MYEEVIAPTASALIQSIDRFNILLNNTSASSPKAKIDSASSETFSKVSSPQVCPSSVLKLCTDMPLSSAFIITKAGAFS
jgi:hypothetical protein